MAEPAASPGLYDETPIDLKMYKSLDLEELDTNLYRSRRLWKPPGARGVFGGQIIGQSLHSAHRTVDTKTMQVHSLHALFLRAGDNSIPVIYRVDRVRDGRSFCTRNVMATQGGKAIFSVLVSFHTFEHSPLDHQAAMPEVPAPEDLPTRENQYAQMLEAPGVHPKFVPWLRDRVQQPLMLDMRSVDKITPPWQSVKKEPRQMLWMKTRGRLGNAVGHHHCVAAYASDYSLVSTAAFPAGFPNANIAMVVSLDHSMWFHAPFRADEWMLYEMESPRARAGRGLVFGRIFTQDGTLAVSVAQEGLIRFAVNKAPSSSSSSSSPAAGKVRPAKASSSSASPSAVPSSSRASGKPRHGGGVKRNTTCDWQDEKAAPVSLGTSQERRRCVTISTEAEEQEDPEEQEEGGRFRMPSFSTDWALQTAGPGGCGDARSRL